MYIYVYIMACRAGPGPEEGRAGLAALTAPQHVWRFAKSCGWIIYIMCGVSRLGWGRRSARVAASSAHSGGTSDCGATCVGIVYVCAVLVSHSRCKRGLPATSG